MSPARSGEAIDIFDYLPHSTLSSFEAGETIYSYYAPASHFYLVVRGRVRVSRIIPDRSPLILDIYSRDEIFGESALLDHSRRSDVAVALEPTDLMMWSAEEIRNVIQLRPQVGVALGQILTQRLIAFGNRLESFAAGDIKQRLVRALIHLAERLGQPAKDGSVHITGLRHEILSEYVISSRGSVTHWLKYFRRKGLLDYNRHRLWVFPPALAEWLKLNSGDSGRTASPEQAVRRKPPTSEARALSRREIQIMELVADGLRNKEIADRLRLSPQTIKNHLQSVFEKLAVADRRQAVRRLALLKRGVEPLAVLTSPARAS
jgi:CRP-like cAMP-binding protein/DNA-binding CsgD family transcriptional regulator